MRKNGNTPTPPRQPELAFETPAWFVPAVQTRQPDGSVVVRAGKPVAMSECLGTREAARLLGLSQRHIESLCDEGDFKTAHKIGVRTRCRWRISRAEVWARLRGGADA